jgi:hypothetical protein
VLLGRATLRASKSRAAGTAGTTLVTLRALVAVLFLVVVVEETHG